MVPRDFCVTKQRFPGTLKLLNSFYVAAATVAPGDSESTTEKSSRSCNASEQWSICGKICEPSCNDPCPKRELCPAIVSVRNVKREDTLSKSTTYFNNTNY